MRLFVWKEKKMFDVWVCIRYGGIEMHMMCILECFLLLILFVSFHKWNSF